MSDQLDIQDLIANINDVTETKRPSFIDGREYADEYHSKNNLLKLKELAPQQWPALVEAFNNSANLNQKIALCEVLHSTDEPQLAPFFAELLKSDNAELRDCALLALAKLGRKDLLPDLFSHARSTTSLRRQYYVGLALVRLNDKRGIDVLVAVLEQERTYVSYKKGYIKNPPGTLIYCCFVSNLLAELFGENADDPFKWIDWWKNNRDQVQLRDLSTVPNHFFEYFHNY